MPRPGPRPYECVRRAWHSDRHQPIRGSLIQEIFRIANEIHSPETRKKKEWQEKLPIVVLKAEEILYSKANSEAEYMDIKTLGDRINDAINTIIRREDGTEETGEFLQPCIEAALHLGCVPRRTSRSQRNINQRGYLTGNSDLSNVAQGNPRLTSPLAPHYATFLGKDPNNLCLPLKSCLNNEPFLCSQNTLTSQGPYSSQSYGLYPLYYGAYSQPNKPQLMLGDHSSSTSISNNRHDMATPRNFFLGNEENSKSMREEPRAPINQPTYECDLSLRLGLSSSHQEHEDSTINVVCPKKKLKETFSLYHEIDRSSRDESLDINLMLRKRKAKFFPSYPNEGTSNGGQLIAPRP